MNTELALNLIPMGINDPQLQSAHSRRGYVADIQEFNRWRGTRVISKTLVEEFAADLLAQGRAPASVNRKLSAIRWACRHAVDQLVDSGAPSKMIDHLERIATVKGVRGSRLPAGREIGAPEVSALLQHCRMDPTNAGIRDGALIAVMHCTGMRRAEVTGLNQQDIQLDGDVATVKIRGKGNKERTGFVFGGALSALNDWLMVRGEDPGAVFCPVNKGGTVYAHRHLSGEALRQILEKRIRRAGLQHLTCHDFRRSLCSNLLDQNVDLVLIQKTLGHANVTTTARYDRRPDQQRKNAVVKNIFTPYFSRN